MKELTAISTPYNCLLRNGEPRIFPYLLHEGGEKKVWNVSPNHGRSYVVDIRDEREYVVTKGNGLNYSSFTFINTGELGDDTWGLLLRKDAERDFLLGNEIRDLGLKTNKMEAVVELDVDVVLPSNKIIHPFLLQYTVECPYRIEDFAFMPQEYLHDEVSRWEELNEKGFAQKHLIAADVLLRNLRTLHDHNILHNAIHIGNYTWALELLDFELACSPKHPYDKEDYQRHVIDLFDREISHTYVIINYIAACLREDVDYKLLDGLFENYGFDLSKYQVQIKQ